MKKLIIAAITLISVSCHTAKVASVNGNVTVMNKRQDKHNVGVYKYYLQPNYKGRSFIIYSTENYAIGDTLKFNLKTAEK